MKILIVQSAFLGDVTLSTPVIRAVAELFPNAERWLLTTAAAAPLVANDPLLTGVITVDKRGADRGVGGMVRLAAKLRSYRFDRVYSLHRSLRTALILALAGIPERIGFTTSIGAWLFHRTEPRPPALHDVLRNLAIVGPGVWNEELRLFPPRLNELTTTEQSVLARCVTPIVIAPGSAWETKRWPLHHHRALVAKLVARGVEVVVTGSAAEERDAALVAEPGALNVAGQLSLGGLLVLMSQARAVVCHDSMTLHVASALQRPTVAIFCSTVPAFGFGPWKTVARIVERNDLPCRPCSRHGRRRCPLGTDACREGIMPEQVLAALDEVL